MTYELLAQNPRLVDNVPQRWVVRVAAGKGYPDDLVVETEWERVTLLEATMASQAFEEEVRGNPAKFFGPVS